MATMTDIWFKYLGDIGSDPAEKHVCYNADINGYSEEQRQEELKELEQNYHTRREELEDTALRWAEKGYFCTAIATNRALQSLMLDYARKRDEILGTSTNISILARFSTHFMH